MGKTARIQVLLTVNEAQLFEAYCQQKGYKKSTLIARLVREHLSREGIVAQSTLGFEPVKPNNL